MAQSEVDALLIAPQRTVNPHGRTQRAAAARVPNQMDVHMGRGEDVREAVTIALDARQQSAACHAKETADLVVKAFRKLEDERRKG